MARVMKEWTSWFHGEVAFGGRGGCFCSPLLLKGLREESWTYDMFTNEKSATRVEIFGDCCLYHRGILGTCNE